MKFNKIICLILVLVLTLSCIGISTTASTTILGDINDDTYINATDVLYLRKYLANNYTKQDINYTNADVDVDKNVNLFDLLYLRKYLVGELTFEQIKADLNLLDNISGVTLEAEYLGNPAASRYTNSSSAHYYARNAWDMAVKDGKVLISNGNYGDNTGSVPIFYYTNDMSTYATCSHSNGSGLSSEEIKRFFTIDGEIYATATDPLGMNQGTYYWFNSNTNKWQHYDTLTYGIHIYDMVEYDGKVFFGGMYRHSSSSDWVTSCVHYLDKDDLKTSTKSTAVKFYYADGTEFTSEPYVSEYNGNTYYRYDYWRCYDMFVFKGELYAIHNSGSTYTTSAQSGLFKYDKDSNKFIMVYDGKAIKGANAVTRHTTFLNYADENGTYVSGGVLCYYSFQDNSYVTGGLKYGDEVVASELIMGAEISTEDTFIAVCNGIFKSTNVEATSNAFTEVSLGTGNEKYVVRDAFELDGKYYFLASQMNGIDDFTTTVFETDGNFETFRKVLSFDTPSFARSFVYNEGCLYVGLGGNGEIDNAGKSANATEYAGRIYRVNLNDYK